MERRSIYYNVHDPESARYDLGLITMGYEECEPAHFFGPAIRDHYLIHFVTAGSGIFRNPHGTFRIGRGDLFLIRPSEWTYYRADDSDPWIYCWAGFAGSGALRLLADAGFDERRPVVHTGFPDRMAALFSQMSGIAAAHGGCDPGCLASLYMIFHLLQAEHAPDHREKIPHPSGSRDSFQKAVQYIELRYPYRIGIAWLSRHIGIDRTALFRAFIREAGVSPKEYLIRFRIGKACELLRRTPLPVSEIAESVGMPDLSHFSDLFKSRTGVSPREYRRLTPGDPPVRPRAEPSE